MEGPTGEKRVEKHTKINQAIEHLQDSASMLNGLLCEINGEPANKISEESKATIRSLENVLTEGANLIMGESARIRDLINQIKAQLF